MPNCVLSKGCVVGSNAVVTKSAEKENVLAGVPTKIIKEEVETMKEAPLVTVTLPTLIMAATLKMQ